ncbi:NAD(P)H-hydrate dehydratase [Dysgonomonas reticulitermitis]
MKILTGTQIKEADRYTIENEPIASIDLMERASNAISHWISVNINKQYPFLFLIGKGNNGGDGLAVARILSQEGYNCSVLLAFDNAVMTDEWKINLDRLPMEVKPVGPDFISADTIIVDSLLGTGVTGEVKEPLLSVINKINSLPNKVISIDLPSGMKSEFGNKNQIIVKSDITLTLEFPKLAMLLPEAGGFCGKIEILPIGLSAEYLRRSGSAYTYITKEFIDNIILRRDKFAHKGTYGHALLICGSRGMAGAAILSTGAALRSGCGLVTTHIPAEERFSVQAAYPSALFSLDDESCFSELPDNISKYTSVGIGCGLGQSHDTEEAFKKLLNAFYKPMVIDADALNIISENSKMKQSIPKGSILTPHLGELTRLVGVWHSEEEKIALVRRLASNLKSIIIVKGAHTMICLPDGECYFNPTGNSGMAKGGSGDVLTGYITGLLARGYNSSHAAILGVYIHGLAGDRAAEIYGMDAMNSKDLIDNLHYC